MGPYIPPRPKAEWERGPGPTQSVLAIAVHLADDDYDWGIIDRLHGGRWDAGQIQCNGVWNDADRRECGWRSEGPGVTTGDGRSNPHLWQWNIHRAQAGLLEGVEFPELEVF